MPFRATVGESSTRAEESIMSATLAWTARYPATLVLSACVSTSSIATTDGTEALWEKSLYSVTLCQGAMNDGMGSTAECFLGDGINSLFDSGVGLADELGKETLGEHFSITGRMNWSPDVGGTGDLDMVKPLSFAGSENLAGIQSASFMQQGVTRWRDRFGAMRNDMRHGVVHRFRVGDRPDWGMVGLSSFYLHSNEHGLEVFALGLDYIGRWGTGEFRYFSPITGWKTVGPGHQERPL